MLTYLEQLQLKPVKCNQTSTFCLFFLFLFFSHDKSLHAKQHGCCYAIGFFNHMIITGCDWLVIHVKIMVITFIYCFVQPFAVIGCVLGITICRIDLYVNFYKIIVLGLFFLSLLICEMGLLCGDMGYNKKSSLTLKI